MSSNRAKNSMRNFVTAAGMQIVALILSFVCRTFFVKLLPTEYLGLSGTFSNIISVLSLSELGIGSAIIVNLYKPIANNDYVKIRQLMNFYSLAYKVIGVFVICCGLILYPFIPYLCKSDVPIPGIQYYFLIFILQSASSYFFAYRRSILTAYQKEYICTLSTQLCNVAMNVIQIIVLYLTGSYLLYLLVGIMMNVTNNLLIYFISAKMYPFLHDKPKVRLSRTETKSIFRDLGSMMVLKIGRVVVDSTDSLLISSYLGVWWNGLYANYLLLINSVNTFVTLIFSSISASVGDFNACHSSDKVYTLYKTVAFAGYWIYGFCGICFAVLLQPFIHLWIGTDYLLDYTTVLIVVICFYCAGMVRVAETFSYVTKVFNKTKIKAISMAGVNLVTSVIFMQIFGLKGIFLGTLCGYLSSGLWVDSYFLFTRVFQRKAKEYFFTLGKYTAVTVFTGAATFFVSQIVGSFILKALICATLPNMVFVTIYCRTPEFRILFSKLKGLLLKRGN